MPDLWMDVDTDVQIPVNLMPLVDPTDFKTLELAIAYNETGMLLTWNFVTTAGVQTSTAVTPTTAGAHDWLEEGTDRGMYSCEIPAASGTVNNDTEGFGWWSGTTTNCLPFRGPTVGFRRAALNDLFIDGSTASTNLEDFFDGTGYAGGTTKLVVSPSGILPGKNVALNDIEFLMVDATDFATPETGLTVSGTRSIDGAAFGAVTGTIAEVANGIYQLDASQADMNGTIITFRFTATGAADRFLTIRTTG